MLVAGRFANHARTVIYSDARAIRFLGKWHHVFGFLPDKIEYAYFKSNDPDGAIEDHEYEDIANWLSVDQENAQFYIDEIEEYLKTTEDMSVHQVEDMPGWAKQVIKPLATIVNSEITLRVSVPQKTIDFWNESIKSNTAVPDCDPEDEIEAFVIEFMGVDLFFAFVNSDNGPWLDIGAYEDGHEICILEPIHTSLDGEYIFDIDKGNFTKDIDRITVIISAN